jgi:energy-coupling factor transporter ATP-binding protein EcfA2
MSSFPAPHPEPVERSEINDHSFWTGTVGRDTEDSTIAALPSNHHALALGFDFACGQRTFVGIGGPSGWGKSELLGHVRNALERIQGSPIAVLQASEWAISQANATSVPVLLLDDLQDVMRSPRLRHLLRLRLDQRIRRKLPTMVCTAGDFSSAIRLRVITPGHHWHLSQILPPSPVERQCIAQQIAKVEKLKLHESIEALLATHLNGNGRSMRGAMLRLKLIRTDWRADEDFAEACGILMPYLIGEDGWDPRDVAADAINYVYMAWPDSPPIRRRASLAYVLNQLIRLPEEDVASFLRISTGQVYRHCRNVRDRLDCPVTAEFINIVQTHVYSALSHSAKWLE